MMIATANSLDNAFSGSYLPTDVTLLLDIVTADSVNDVNPEQKEQLIQSGKQHYSDMLTLEQPPTATHEALFYQALAQGKQRMANEIADLAMTLHALFTKQVTDKNPLILVSLVRAGLPIGVLLQRALSDDTTYHLPSHHYGVSIIRDRGLDPVALEQILIRHPNSPLVFVDGWTGKGAIYGELQRSLRRLNAKHFSQLFHQGGSQGTSATKGVIPLVTLADPAGVAWLSASSDDWLMPASLLNSTVSGLISRTLYRDANQGLHQAVFYDNLKNVDKSLEFAQTIDMLRKKVTHPKTLSPQLTPTFATQAVIDGLASRFNISNRNRIKPTIAEATRAILRRDPDCVLVNDSKHPHGTALLRHLCVEKNLTLIQDASIAPYTAVTIIKQRAK